MGFFAQGYLALYDTYGDDSYLERAKYCLDWLTNNHAQGYSGYCWGNHFDYQARGGRIAHGVPTVVWTGLIGHAFMDAYELLHEPQYLDVAQSACECILQDFGWRETSEGLCISYTPGVPSSIHNSNMIGAALLARVFRHIQKARYLEISERATQFTASHQLKSGAWYYGVDPKWQWVDSFHTGYVLESMHYVVGGAGADTYRKCLLKGYSFFVTTFFAPDGTPRYYDHKTRPLDIQCASQGIQTLVNLRELNKESIPVAQRVAQWTIDNMQDRSGYFYFRKYPCITNRTATFHWGQATMFAALAMLNRCTLRSNGSNI